MLLRLDLLSLRAEWVDVGVDDMVGWGSGLCADDNHIFHVSIGKTSEISWLTILDRRSLSVVEARPLPGTYDPHSIRMHQGRLCVASTGTDEVVAFDLSDTSSLAPELLWSPSGSGSDLHHVNSLAVVNGDLVCSAFGPKMGGSWISARAGYIYNITRDLVLVEGLHQPHSVTWHDDALYYCDSQEGAVKADGEVVAYVAGYPRGLDFGRDGTLYVGTSVARPAPITDESGVLLEAGDRPRTYGRCAVVHVSDSGMRAEIGLADYGREIYDVMLVPGSTGLAAA